MRPIVLTGFFLGFVAACGGKVPNTGGSDAGVLSDANAGEAGCSDNCGAGGAFCWLGACVKVTAVAARGSHTCALTSAGGVQCWGENTHGQLGNNSTIQSNVPVAVSGLSSGVSAITAGDLHTCALTTAGGVQCWGDNFTGQLGNNSTSDSNVPVPVEGLSSGVAAITAGHGHTCALTTAGGVLCWGDGGAGELGNNSTLQRTVPFAVSGLSTGVAAIAAGYDYTCAVTAAAGVQCWGGNIAGELGNNSTAQSNVPVAVSGLSLGVVAITAGDFHTCAMTMGTGAQCWGDNAGGDLGNNSTVESNVPVAVSGLSSSVAAIAAGTAHTCALTTYGGVQCWGDSDYGEPGQNPDTHSSVPVAVPGLSSGVAAIAAGDGHTCAMTTGGVQCWGANASGELGNNSTMKSLVPVSVVEP